MTEDFDFLTTGISHDDANAETTVSDQHKLEVTVRHSILMHLNTTNLDIYWTETTRTFQATEFYPVRQKILGMPFALVGDKAFTLTQEVLQPYSKTNIHFWTVYTAMGFQEHDG
jgi:hypothetical protein